MSKSPLHRGWTRGVLYVVFSLALGLAPAMAQSGESVSASTEASGDSRHHARVLRLDIAMDGTSFHFEGPTNAAGFPADGTPFIVRGYLYPKGTFADNGSSSGTLADGSPEFPEKVIGTWYCRGWHLQDGDALTGPIVATTQIFDLHLEKPGRRTIVTDGIELADFDVGFRRALVGGTGRYAQARGQQWQVYLDLNASNGFNTSTVLRVDR